MKFFKSNHRRRNLFPRIAVEALESREVLSATLLDNGTWNIVGTNANDQIFVTRDEVDSSVLVAELNGRVIDEQYAADVARIQISGGLGNDRIEIDETGGAIANPNRAERQRWQ